MNTLRQDIRFGLRMLLKSPGFTAVAVLSLAIGIGANTTIFCWIQTVLMNPVPGTANPDQLVVLVSTHGAATYDTVSYPDLKDYASLADVFSGVIGSQITPALLSVNGKAEWVFGQIATANYFDVLGVKAILGRTFLPEEDRKPGGHPVMVISHGLWQRRFGGDRNVVGKTVELNRRPFTIVGVAPADFNGTMGALRFDFWAPLMMHEEVANFGSLEVRHDRWLHTQARLKPGVSMERAQIAASLLAQQLEQAYPKEDREIGIRVLPMWKAPYGGQSLMLPVLQILIAVSGVVLLIVAANVANLLLARATSRRKEIAIRLALGAGRLRLIRQLLTESIVLSLVGGAAGVLLANWAVDLFMFFIPNTHLPIGYTFKVNYQTLGFTFLLALATGIIFGLVPALQAIRTDLHDTLKEGGRSPGSGSAHHNLRAALVVAEVALALLLLVGAGLCIKGFERARQMDPGFNPENVFAAGLRIGASGYNEQTGLIFYRKLHQRLTELPGVVEAGLASWLPLGFEGGPGAAVEPEGYVRLPNEDVTVPYAILSPGYFAAMRIPMLEGRDFTDQDDQKAQAVAIINDNFARRFWPGQDPIGRRIRAVGRTVTVVGLVRSGKYRSLNESPRPFIYLPYQQGVWDLNLGVVLRTKGDPASIIGVLRQTIHELDPGVEVWAGLPMTDYIKAAFLAQKVTATLLIILGVTALLLASIGIYGVMAYTVNQRTQEFGIRMALGAQSSDVLGLVLRQGMLLGVAGVTIGLAG
ncbi:MAG TPA: ABC transporter permease, partial [Acidobacteriota bacterium]|nr:ABC transporter permease [Acidobacteriota bacterium]